MIVALYNNKEYECTFTSDGIVRLLSTRPEDSFIEFFGTYSKDVKREECSRVYGKTRCFKYNNDNFLVREEKQDMVLLETGPRAYDLREIGFQKILNDTFQKWVSVNEGELYWSYTEY